jgi:dihydrofolate reductase
MLSLIVAHDLNRGIGFDNKLLCHIKDDMKLFKDVTTFKTIVMGRKTFESIGKPLPNRKTIVLSKTCMCEHEDVFVFDSIKDVLVLDCQYGHDIIICGGSSIYEQFLPYVDRLYITEIQNTFKADSYFPQIDLENYQLTHMKYYPKDENNESGFVFKIYDKYNK